ncbi:hypothetical protein DI270_013600 [Microbispora triticiradicis]|uniref:DUF7824 domain-containing protein n=1 Tax=Microbispora triticiradicis TaxID=2200763 RepID=A0ABX9LN60_9ACTN|nr:DUF6493 family protein [Microbispora triticiradicis]RGA04514.1 hypothetical protein DI270_013600 [Microbispora triticiradicis]
MDDHWGEIRKLIEARRAERLAERVRTLGDEGRREVAVRLPGLLKELRGVDRWDDGLSGYRVGLRVAGAGCLGGAAAVTSWLYRRDLAPRWGGADNDVDLVLAVLADRPAAWRADLAERLVLRLRSADDRGVELALALLRETGIEPPPHDPLVAGWVDRGPARLGEDPLLDHLLPRLFEAEGVGRTLQWDREPGRGWLGALPNLAEAGRVKREALIDGCVRRFLRGGTPTDLRFFVRLHEALAPSPAEASCHVRDYLHLLPAAPGPVAELAVKRLRSCAELPADDLAEAWDCLLFRPERTLVRAGLSWLARSVKRTPALAEVIAAPLARAFAADSAELQETAAGLAMTYADDMPEEGRAALREAIGFLPPALGRRAAAAFAGGAVAEAEAMFTPPSPPPAPERARAVEPPIRSAEELSQTITEWTDSWQSWERLLAGFVVLAGRDRPGLVAATRDRLTAEHAWTYAQETWPRAEQWLRGAATALNGDARTRHAWRRFLPGRGLAGPDLLLLHRGAEILRAVEEDTLPPVLLATPTHDTGHVAAAELVRRLEVIEAAGAKPLAADLQQALLRLPRTPDPEAAERAARLTSAAGGIVAGWTCPEAHVTMEWTCEWGHQGPHDWRDRSHAHHVRLAPAAVAAPTGLPLIDLVLSVPGHWAEPEHVHWWPSTLPSHREVAAAYLTPHLLQHYWYGPVVRAQARHLARAEGPAGPAFSAVLARALGDRNTREPVDVLLEVAARDELPAAEIGRQAGLLLVSGEVRMIDMVAALDEAARRGGHDQVWRIAAAALPALLPAPGERPRGGLTGFVTLARMAAEWCDARGEIPEVRDVAARKGNSGLLREIRRLHDRLTEGTDGTGQEG